MAQCSICDVAVDKDTAPILSMGAYGNPKYLCEECAAELDKIMQETDFNVISEAMDHLGKKMGDRDPDGQTFEAVSRIMAKAAIRAKAIKEGTYDFSLDEKQNEESFEEIPEDLLETEEDIKITEEEKERERKFDKIFNWISIIVLAAAGVFLIYRLLDTFLF